MNFTHMLINTLSKDNAQFIRSINEDKNKQIFSFEDAESMKTEISTALSKLVPYHHITINTLGGKEKFALMIAVTLETKANWENGIINNGSLMRWIIKVDGSMEQFQAPFWFRKTSKQKNLNFRKTRVKDVKDIIAKFKKYIPTVKHLARREGFDPFSHVNEGKVGVDNEFLHRLENDGLLPYSIQTLLNQSDRAFDGLS